MCASTEQFIAFFSWYGAGDLPLTHFVRESGLELGVVLKSDKGWTRLRQEAGFETRVGGPHEAALLRRVRALAHVDDAEHAVAYGRLLADDGPTYQELTAVERRYARMLFFSLWPNGGGRVVRRWFRRSAF